MKHRITLKFSISQLFFIWVNPEEYFYLMETTPSIKPVKWDKYWQKYFLIENEARTVKLCLSEKPLTGEFLMDSVKNNETKEIAVE